MSTLVETDVSIERSTSTTTIVSDDVECSQPRPEHKGLWTNGLPDHEKIKRYIARLAQHYANKKYPVINTGHFQFERDIAQRKRAQEEFFGELHYLEDLMHLTPVLPLRAVEQQQVQPYQPATKRRRGRPATGIKPRDRRKRPDDEPY